MVIDAHFHPIFFEELCPTDDVVEKRKNMLAYYKTGRMNTARAIEISKLNGVDKIILLPHDYSTQYGDVISNEDMAALAKKYEGDFFPFAAVDPHSPDAEQKLEHAFKDLGLCGLKLHPSKQAFFPQDKKYYPLYEICLKYNKPITFHAGMSWEPNALMEYSRPMNFERIAVDFPKLRFSLAHMGFPWIVETAALLAKYPNVYADTSALYFDSAYEFYEYMFTKAMDVTWLDRALRHQVMFGTNNRRWHAKRTLKELDRLGLRDETVELIKGQNALEFLGEKEVTWIS